MEDGPMRDKIDLALAEYNRAIDDYVSLSRWSWGIVITFATGVLYTTAQVTQKTGADTIVKQVEIFGDICRAGQAGIVVVLGALVLTLSALAAHRRVVVGKAALEVSDLNSDPRVQWVLGGGYRDETGRRAFALRLMPAFVVLLIYYFMVNDVKLEWQSLRACFK